MSFILARRSLASDLQARAWVFLKPYLARYSSAVSPWEARCFRVMTLKDLPHSRQVMDASLMAFLGSMIGAAVSSFPGRGWPVVRAAMPLATDLTMLKISSSVMGREPACAFTISRALCK